MCRQFDQRHTDLFMVAEDLQVKSHFQITDRSVGRRIIVGLALCRYKRDDGNGVENDNPVLYSMNKSFILLLFP